MTDIYSTGVLTTVVNSLPPPEPFILNSFFREISLADGEEIHFDVVTGNPRLAPFVSPLAPAPQVESPGYQTNTFKPAYVKDKRIFNPNAALRRAIGEKVGGQLPPQQRVAARLAADLKDQLEMLTRRQEVMALEALRTGKITVSGAAYPTCVVDFERHADLTKTLTLDARWGEPGVSPLDDLQRWSMEIGRRAAATATQVVMDTSAWSLLSADPAVQKLLDRYRGADKLVPTVTGDGARHMGNIGDFDIWIYAGQYCDDAGALVPFLPEYTVMLLSPELEGIRAYGAIRDQAAGFRSVAYFSKSWAENDPAVRILLMQSAPLPVPSRINASLCATVR